jgi:hypothetical protein
MLSVRNLLFKIYTVQNQVAVAPQPAATAAHSATTTTAAITTHAVAASEATAIDSSKPATVTAVVPAAVPAVTTDPAFEWVYMIYCGWVTFSMIITVYTGVGAGQASPTDVSDLFGLLSMLLRVHALTLSRFACKTCKLYKLVGAMR